MQLVVVSVVVVREYARSFYAELRVLDGAI
jgi:hypothetical protein